MKKCILMAKRYGLMDYVLGDGSGTVPPANQHIANQHAGSQGQGKEKHVKVSTAPQQGAYVASKVDLRSTSKKSLKRKTPQKTKKKKRTSGVHS
jgi:hypothetical protein